METAREGICIADEHDRITWFNHRFVSMLARRPSGVIGRHFCDFVAPQPAEQGREDLARQGPGRTGTREILLRRADGSLFWTGVSTSLLHEGKHFAGVLRMFTDISDRKALEEARAQLVRYLVDAQEAERRRIARELHDQMGQHLVGLGLALRRLRQPGVTAHDVERLTSRLEALTQTMVSDVHHLALELRPPSLDDFGLLAAVSHYADTVASRAGLQIEIQCSQTPRLDPSVETTVYRIIQESLTNVVKHATATRVSVILERRDTQLVAIVEDNGAGFDAPAMLLGRVPGRGLGIGGMMERAALVDGALDIESSPGHGTTVYLRVPVARKGEADEEEAARVAR